MDWLLLQLADAAFPTGGFAHSAGLEASAQLGLVRSVDDLRSFAQEAAWQVGYAALPFLNAAYEEDCSLDDSDALCEVFLSSQVTRRASRTQGRALLSTMARVFDEPRLTTLEQRVRSGELCGHHAPVFGAALRILSAPRHDAQRVYLHTSVRGVLSASVRLGIVGPLAAQALQRALTPTLDDVLERCGALGLDALAQPAPLLELCGSLQDELYSRLFQS